MGFTRDDKELRKFDDSGNVKVSIEADNSGGGGASSVTVTNAVGSPVPVSIINSNSDNDLEVTVKNAFQYVYDMVYDGSQWRFQLSDSNGKAIELSRTYYTTADITALGSSTSINDWLGAYNDNMLQKIFVQTYDQEHEAVTYYIHPSLDDGDKCLKLTRTYSTENSKRVVKTVQAAVADWNYDDDLEGTITNNIGTITSPNPSSAIAVGTDICTVAVVCTTGGSVTLALSGTNAALYTLRNVTDGTTGASLAYNSAKSYVLETANDFSGSSYSHSVTITATEDAFSKVATSNIATSGTYVAPAAFQNLKGVTRDTSGTSTTSVCGIDTNTAIADGANSTWSVSFWMRSTSDLGTAAITNGNHNYDEVFVTAATLSGGWYDGFNIDIRGKEITVLYSYSSSSWYRIITNSNVSEDLYDGAWHQVVVTHSGTTDSLAALNSNIKIYVDASAVATIQASQGGSPHSVTRTWTPYFGKGGLVGSHVNVFSREVDECALWSGHELSAANVTTIYNSGTPTDLTDTTGITVPTKYYRFEETDLGYETIADGATADETSVTAVTLDGTDSIYIS